MNPPRIAYAGEPGSFGEDAALGWGVGGRTVSVPTFRDVFEAVTRGRSEAGVVPIENVSQGTVREVYDLLLEHELAIVGEVEVPVRLCLAALPGQALAGIERVYSHVQALSQAEPFLRSGSWTLLAATTTSSAGADLVGRAERGAAAVLSPRAAALHGLEVLAHDIQADERNRTRFLVLAATPSPSWLAEATGPGASGAAATGPEAAIAQGAGAAQRTTLAFGVANEPGTLVRVLAVFAAHGLNMSKLESRPSRERAWEYVFWADLDADLCVAAAEPLLAELRAATVSLRLMGCYPAATPR